MVLVPIVVKNQDVPDHFSRELWNVRCIDYALDKSCK